MAQRVEEWKSNIPDMSMMSVYVVKNVFCHLTDEILCRLMGDAPERQHKMLMVFVCDGQAMLQDSREEVGYKHLGQLH